MNKKVILLILDGWGIASDKSVSAIDQADTPFMDSLYHKYPNAQLLTHGMQVGLPEGQMGNSEVGHMNLGAGRIVYQELAKINLAIQSGDLQQEKVLKEAFNYAKKHHKNVHFLGLLSDGGVHSHMNHLFALIDAAEDFGLEDCFVHAFTDGRDVDPRYGKGFIEDLLGHLEGKHTSLASVTGRYYAMDRDKRWERVALAYNALVKGEGEQSTDVLNSINESYQNDVTDEFLKPIILNKNDQPVSKIAENDVVIFFNFRTDRGRQLTEVLTQKDHHEFGMSTIPLYYVTMTNYDESFKNIHVIYEKDNLNETLGEVLSNAGKSQLRMAETEKYPHVTFFFSGGREEPFEGEYRILKSSPKVATYDLQPEMSAIPLKDALLQELNKGEVDFVCLNFANGDMVGHTGDFDAAKKACETVDSCVNEIVNKAIQQDYTIIIIADHGNCDIMKNSDGSPHTAHTTNPVPVIVVDKDIERIDSGNLGDIAPTVLKLMGIKKPESMTQNSLI